jgi:hypothetical protein
MKRGYLGERRICGVLDGQYLDEPGSRKQRMGVRLVRAPTPRLSSAVSQFLLHSHTCKSVQCAYTIFFLLTHQHMCLHTA